MIDNTPVIQKRIAQVSLRLLTAPVMADDSLHDAIVAALRHLADQLAAEERISEGNPVQLDMKAEHPAGRWRWVLRDQLGNEFDVLVDIIGQDVPR